MKLREQAGGNKDLFSVERKMKRLQRKQQKQSEREYDRQSKKKDVFNFINDTLSKPKSNDPVDYKLALKEQSHRDLNIKNLQITSNIKKTEDSILILRNSLSRHNDASSETYKQIVQKIAEQQTQLNVYEKQAQLIKNELNLRSDRKKMTEF